MAELKILSAGAVKRGVAQIAKAFEGESGNRIAVEFATGPEIRRRVAAGETVVTSGTLFIDRAARRD